eukprot:TRINITY_DN419_c1_g3_i1.p1 TRINITY_DN419_c1_g3~~TRINITY_DN419_c1_g3_i1.p1  ORF type:complete len:492 (-),score=149.29 TRINITY_DN419_c1_g3_i1:56-1531(-)
MDIDAVEQELKLLEQRRKQVHRQGLELNTARDPRGLRREGDRPRGSERGSERDRSDLQRSGKEEAKKEDKSRGEQEEEEEEEDGDKPKDSRRNFNERGRETERRHDAQTSRDWRDARANRDERGNRDARDNRDARANRDERDNRDNRENRDNHDNRGVRDADFNRLGKRIYENEHDRPNLRRRVDGSREDAPRRLMSTVVRANVVEKTSKDEGESAEEHKKVLAEKATQEQKLRSQRLFSSLNRTLMGFQADLASKRNAELLQKRQEVEKTIEDKLKQQREVEIQEQRLKQREQRYQQSLNRLETRIINLERGTLILKKSKMVQANLLGNYIQTAASPSIFWMPKNATDKTTDLQQKTKEKLTAEVQDQLKELDERFQADIDRLRNRLKSLQERKNDPNAKDEPPLEDSEGEGEGEGEEAADSHSEGDADVKEEAKETKNGDAKGEEKEEKEEKEEEKAKMTDEEPISQNPAADLSQPEHSNKKVADVADE